MSDTSTKQEDIDHGDAVEHEEEIKSPSLYPPPNSSPNISSEVNDEVFAFEGEPILADNPLANTFEDDSVNPIPSEMPSLFLRPTEINTQDTMDSEEITKSNLIKEAPDQFEQENQDEGDGSDSDDTVTSPHPASQIEFENNKLEDEFEVNPDSERTSNFRQRITPMPTDPAEDTRDPYMVRKHYPS